MKMSCFVVVVVVVFCSSFPSSQYIQDVMEMYDSTSDSCVSEGEESSPLGGREVRDEPFIRL